MCYTETQRRDMCEQLSFSRLQSPTATLSFGSRLEIAFVHWQSACRFAPELDNGNAFFSVRTSSLPLRVCRIRRRALCEKPEPGWFRSKRVRKLVAAESGTTKLFDSSFFRVECGGEFCKTLHRTTIHLSIHPGTARLPG